MMQAPEGYQDSGDGTYSVRGQQDGGTPPRGYPNWRDYWDACKAYHNRPRTKAQALQLMREIDASASVPDCDDPSTWLTPNDRLLAKLEALGLIVFEG